MTEERQEAWPVWRVARVAASLFVLMVAAYYLVVAFDNITNPLNPNGSNWPFVEGVLSGEGVPEQSGFQWRFITATWFDALSYILIIVVETFTGVTLLAAGLLGVMRSRSEARWARAQRWTFLGGVCGLGLYFFGFITVGGNWFVMYLNKQWNALDAAFQNSMLTVSMLILVTGVLLGSHLTEAKR